MKPLSAAASGVEGELQAGARPAGLEEPAGGRGGDPGVAYVLAPEADVGADQVGEGVVLGAPIGVEGGDAAVQDRRHADLAAGLDGQAVEELVALQVADHPARREAGRRAENTRARQVESPQAAKLGV